MKTDIEKAMQELAKRITSDVKPTEALQFTQATLNLAHTLATLKDTELRRQ